MKTNQNNTEPSLVEPDVRADPQGPRHLTESQAKAFSELCALAKLCGDREAYGGFVPRAKPLLMGPSGAGKTALVTRVCDSQEFPLLVINSGSWIVVGAKAEPYTLHVIRRFVRQNPKGCIFLDEIDKCCPSGDRAWTSEWNLGTTTELLALLDGDQRLLTSGWTREDVGRLRNYMIIGAGAWQRMAKNDGTLAHVKRMIDDPGIPQEVTYRFNSRLIVVQPPNRKDFEKAFERVHSDLGLPQPSDDEIKGLVDAALEARCGLRWVEQYVSDLLALHPQLRRKPEPVAAPKKEVRVIPAWEKREEVANLYRLLESAEPSIAYLQARMALISERLKAASPEKDTLLDFGEKAAGFSKWDQNFADLLVGLHLRYNRSAQEQKEREDKIWMDGQKVWECCQMLMQKQSDLLAREQMLALVVNVSVRISRILSALSYFGAVELSSEQTGN
jgi:hypothetical protein